MSAPKRRTIDPQWSATDMYPERNGQDPLETRRAVESLYPTQPYATHGSVCADLLLAKLSRNERAQRHPRLWRDSLIAEVQRERDTMVGTVLIYRSNVNGQRVPKSMTAQREGFRRNLFASWRIALAALERLQTPAGAEAPGELSGEPSEPQPSSGLQEVQAEEAAESSTVEVESEVETVGGIHVGSSDPLRAHHEWCRGTRRVLAEHGFGFSMRGTIDGIALIAAGLPPAGIRDSCLMEYPEEIREACGVREPYDFASFGVQKYLAKAVSARVTDRGNVRPVNVMLIGPAGTGKTTAASVLADAMGVDRFDVSLSAGTPLSAFFGRELQSGEIVPSEFEQWATGGGQYLFDEFDCGEPNLMKILNKALANREYANPLTGKKIALVESAVALGGANTLGTGTGSEFSAAEQIDPSTIDRFRAGRIRVELDEKAETDIVEAQIAFHTSR